MRPVARPRRRPAYLNNYWTLGEKPVHEDNVISSPENQNNTTNRSEILAEMFGAVPSRRVRSSKIIRRVRAKLTPGKMLQIFPEAKITANRRRKNTQKIWKSFHTVSKFEVNDVRELEKYFGTEFYCRPFRKNVVVLLGPISFKLRKVTITSCKSKLRLRKYQKEDNRVSDVSTSSYHSLLVTFRSSLVSRLAGGERGLWKKDVASLIVNQ